MLTQVTDNTSLIPSTLTPENPLILSPDSERALADEAAAKSAGFSLRRSRGASRMPVPRAAAPRAPMRKARARRARGERRWPPTRSSVPLISLR